jgi:N-acetylmuramoyl-L-alanine amidase
VVIDAGHGGYDLGISTHDLREKDLTLELARKLQRVIENRGRFAYLAREVDHYMSIDERRAAANSRKPDLFLSLHFSGADYFNVYVTGFQKKDAELSLAEYYAVGARQRRHLYESSLFARMLAASLRESFAANVYERELSLPLLDSIGAPAVMVELPTEGVEYKEEMGRIVRAIYNGIGSYELER